MVSSAMKSAERVLRAVANKDVALTLTGESGSGKEVLARRAHQLSGRRRGPFVPINCAAIPESLFESELFGHERGAFTGASDRVKGKVESAQRGTLFFDEIGEMPMLMQAKVLRFIENRRFMRVGGTTKIDADVRLMFATHRPLEREVEAGRFRADLYYRIQGITLHVPALRERRADISPLLDQFVRQLSARHGVSPPRFTREAKALLLRYDWPGNVRELRNVIETACLLREGRRVRAVDLPASVRSAVAVSEAPSADGVLLVRLDDGLDAITRRVFDAALGAARGDKRQAASRLGISLRTLQRYAASGPGAVPTSRARAMPDRLAARGPAGE